MTAMQLTYDDEAEAFRAEIREWLADNLPAGWVDAAERGESLDLTAEERRAFNDEWPKKLFAGGWICATWPIEYGGKGLSTLQGVVLAEEFARVKAPLRADFFGDTLVGPTILQWGSEEQKKEFLPKILRGEMRWCQGFSEPDSGSDLASLKTTAVLDGDEWVINGQKVWTTQGDDADYCFLLTRTDPDAPKHQGISYLLVPMRQPGVEVRRHHPARRHRRVLRGVLQRRPVSRRQRRGRRQRRLEGRQLDAGVRAGPVGDHRLPAFRRGVRAARRRRPPTPRSIADPLIRQRLASVLHEDPDPAHQRPAHAVGPADRQARPGRRRPRRDQQDVLVGDAPAGDGAGPRPLRRRGAADRQRSAVGVVARHAAGRAAATATRRHR